MGERGGRGSTERANRRVPPPRRGRSVRLARPLSALFPSCAMAKPAPSLFPPALLGELPAKVSGHPRFVLRPLSVHDFSKGAPARRAPAPPSSRAVLRSSLHAGFGLLLSELTDTEGLSQSDFERRFEELQRAGDYYVVVVEDEHFRKIVATAALLIEKKFVHKCGSVRIIRALRDANGPGGPH